MPETSRATEAIRRRLADAAGRLPVENHDAADADRGLVARGPERRITAPDGRVIWDLDAYAFLDGPAPDTAHPSLWRQGRLCAREGLFEVVPGIYQVRGFDVSNVSFIEGEEGVIVVDPLTCRETAAAAWALYTAQRGPRPVKAVIYTHSHVDHFGGSGAVVTHEQAASGEVAVLAPEGFLEAVVRENGYLAAAMGRRAGYQYGAALPKGPTGHIGIGLGLGLPTGEITLVPPTTEITHTGQTVTVDGVRIVFQMTPGTEAPVEMNFCFPDLRALCAAENSSHTMHNVLTLRGAVVRDAQAWGHYLAETVDLFGDQTDVVFASHHWPTWGSDEATEFLLLQRDLYLYLHDQTLRMMNQGLVASEIAEELRLPPAIEAAWHAHGYYGSLSHNVKAIYQRYVGWYDGNPAHLWGHPPVEVAKRYVDLAGGVEPAVAKAREAFDAGDFRWAVELLNHVLFADPDHAAARALQADAFEQLGFGAENGTWRNAYLAGAHELRHGQFGAPTMGDLLDEFTVPQILDNIAVRVDGPKAWDEHLRSVWQITDDATYLVELRNGVLNHRRVDAAPEGVTTFTLSRTLFAGLVGGHVDLAAAIADGSVTVAGDPSVLGRLVGVLAPADLNFAIVTP